MNKNLENNLILVYFGNYGEVVTVCSGISIVLSSTIFHYSLRLKAPMIHTCIRPWNHLYRSHPSRSRPCVQAILYANSKHVLCQNDSTCHPSLPRVYSPNSFDVKQDLQPRHQISAWQIHSVVPEHPLPAPSHQNDHLFSHPWKGTSTSYVPESTTKTDWDSEA